MEFSTKSRVPAAAALVILLITACQSIGGSAPGGANATNTPGTTQTPPLVAFPTVGPETQTPSTGIISGTLELGAAVSLPVVQFVSPISNTQISISQTVSVIAYAAAATGITRIELSADNTLVHREDAPTPAPAIFSAVIPWTPTDIGSHLLRLVAFDSSNRASAPEEVTINVTPDTRRPAAVIVSPLGTPQVELGSLLQVQAVAVDEVGVTELDLVVDGQVFTYVTSPNPGGQTPFPIVFTWPALAEGTHTLVVRAHDNQDQTTDSSALRVSVADTHMPALGVAYDRTNTLVNDPITVTITALDVSGIQRVELWVGKDTNSVMTSSDPPYQTMMTTQIAWQSATAGDYPLSVRAYNANGNYKQSPAQTISVLQPGQSTPTPAPTATPTRSRPSRATPTAALQPPEMPIAELISPSDHFLSSAPVRVTFGGKGSAELDHVELWGYSQDQPMPQLVCSVDARATTQKNAQCDWSPATAGLVYLFSQAIDSYHQIARSPTITGYMSVPGLATPTPTPASFAGRWIASTFLATLRQVNTALRGDFKTIDTNTDGRITAGTIKGSRVTFHVDFGPAATPSTPTPLPTPTGEETPTATLEAIATATDTATPVPALAPAIDFDCTADTAGTTLTCTWKDDRGQTGSAMFHREESTP